MAKVKIYERGDHPAGFCGAAVRTSVIGEPVQEYFSFKTYKRSVAIRLANERAKEITELQKIRKRQHVLDGKRNSRYGDRKHILCVNHFTLRLDKHARPSLLYIVQIKNERPFKLQRSFYNEQAFISAYRTCCLRKIEFEKLTHPSSWLAYYESLRPSWRRVKRYFSQYYNFTGWTKK